MDEQLIQLLGQGMAAQAATAKAQRAKKLSQMVDAATAGGQPQAAAGAAPAAGGTPPGGTMPQSQFSGYGQQPSPQEQLLRQRRLAEMLRAREQQMPAQ